MELSEAAVLHRNVPPNWYQRGIKENLGQRYWHFRRFTEIGKLIEPSGGKILDIGSADGTFTKVILERSKADLVVGIDVLPGSVAYAQKRFSRNKKIRFKVANVEQLPFEKEEFDAVFCLEVLEHVFAPQKALKEIKRVLKEDGYAVFLVPIENVLFRIIWLFWENTRGWIWKGTHVHNFSHENLEKLLEESGFKIINKRRFLLGMLKVNKVKKR
jgi:ubiquinone/menaquinone biosynthesis C-methylase UbiE